MCDMTKELTIIGGTGFLSSRMVRLLDRRGMRLKVVARNPERARALFGNAIEIVFGDVENPPSLVEALRGSGSVYIHLNTEALDPEQTFYAEREGVQNIVEAAEAVGVAQLIQIAGIESLRPDFFTKGMLATEQIRRVGMEAVTKSHIPHTFMMCSVFLDSLPRYVNDNTLAVFGGARNHIHFTNTSQLAEHLFHVAQNPASFDKSLAVQGRQGVDFVEGARRFFHAFDPGVSVQQLPIDAIDGFGLPDGEAAFLEHVSEVMSGLKEEFIAGDVHESFGAPSLSIEEFAAELRAPAS